MPTMPSAPPPDQPRPGVFRAGTGAEVGPLMNARRMPLLTTLVGDALSAGAFALRLPSAFRQRRVGVRHDGVGHGHGWPVLLLHGFAGSDAVWNPMAEALRASGFGHVLRLSYNSFLTDPAEVVGAVREQATAARAAAGADGVHLIGHSLGGLLLRHALEHDTSGMGGPATVVTIASPHAGIGLARWIPGSCARLMRPGSSGVRSNLRGQGSIRWITFSSDGVWLVPPSSARLNSHGCVVTNVHVPARGHLTICRDPDLIARVVLELLDSQERVPAAAA